MKRRAVNLALLLVVLLVMVMAIWGPETLAVYKDRSVLNHITELETASEGVGYRYQLSNNEKLYLLSESLSSQSLPRTEQSALTKETSESNYQEGAYAFVVNRKGPTEKKLPVKKSTIVVMRGLPFYRKKVFFLRM